MLKSFINTTSLKANIVANYTGNFWAAAISVVFVPLYFKYIGAEAYGLIGVFASLQVALLLLDSGLSTTLSKELSRLSVLPESNTQIRNLVKTLGTVYWGIAIVAGLIAIGLSPLIANYWVQPKELTVDTIVYAFIILSITLTFQFTIGFYSGGLLGLQKHVKLNAIRVVFSTLRSVGALCVLILVSNSVLAFFSWNLAIMVIQTLALKYAVWNCLPEANTKAVFDKQQLKNIRKFAAGITVITITAILLTQLDKIILSKLLSLGQFGYYSVASTVGLMLYQIIGPITQSYFPKFSALVSTKNIAELKKIYHQGCQLVSALVLPAALILIFYSKELIWIWTQDELLTENTWLATSIIAFGTGLNGLINLPYQLTLAYSWTKLGLYQNISLLCFMTPLTIFLAMKYDAVGGALSWAIINVIYLMITPNLIHFRLLKNESKKWYLYDTFLPLAASLLVVFASAKIIQLDQSDRWSNLFVLTIVGIMAVVASILVSNDLRPLLLKRVLSSKHH